MKKMYLGSAFPNSIRGLAFIIMSISFLSACGDEREDGTVITKEDFVPVGLPGRVHMLCFETDSIGYAASPLLTKKNGRHYRDRFVVSKTSDRGRNWKAVGKIDGSCLNISECGRRIFVVSTNRYRRNYEEGRDISEIVVIDKDDLSSERIVVEYGDIWGFHIFNDSTYTYRLGRDENCSYIITRDYGRKWEKVSVPGRPVGYKVAFCGNTMFIPASVRADSTYRRILYAKDVISSNIRALKTGNLYDIQAADSLLAFYPV